MWGLTDAQRTGRQACTVCLCGDLPNDPLVPSPPLPVSQEVTKPDVFWYTAPTQIDLPFVITGLVAFELFVMHVSGRLAAPRPPTMHRCVRTAAPPLLARCCVSWRAARSTGSLARLYARAQGGHTPCSTRPPTRPPLVPQWVESRRGYDIKNPGSMDQDPIFSNFKLPAHEVSRQGRLRKEQILQALQGPDLER